MTQFDISKKFDLAAKAEAGAVMEVKDPVSDEPLINDAGVPLTITLRGKDAPEVRKAAREYASQKLNKLAKAKKLEIREEDGIAELVAATVTWTGFTADGQEIPCTPQNARQLYTSELWIREQADAFMENREVFLKKPQKNSQNT